MSRNRCNDPSLLLDVWFLAQTTSRWIAESLPESPFSPDEFGFCSALAQADGVTSAQAAAITGLPASTVTSMAIRLQRQGILDAASHPTDRRARLWRLTESGMAHFEAIEEQFAIAYRALVADLPQAMAQAASDGMGAIDAALRAALGLPERDSRSTASPMEPTDPLTAAERAELATYEAWLRHRRTTVGPA